MGFSVSAATAIIFAGLVLVMGIVIDAAFDTYQDLKDAAVDITDATEERARTNTRFVNASYNATRVFLNVSNAGQTTLDPTQVDVLINGSLLTEKIQVRQVGGMTTTVWDTSEVLFLEIDYAGANGDTRIRFVTMNGMADTMVMK